MMFAAQPRMILVWFDRSIIRTNWKKINRSPLQKAGALVVTEARSSIKRRALRGKPSPIGTPPRSRQQGSVPPFKQIYALPNTWGTSVIAGMVGYGTDPAIPGLHEHGGRARRKIFRKGAQRRLRTGRYGKSIITYTTEMVTYPIRDFMWPALRRIRAKLPHLWLNSVSRG